MGVRPRLDYGWVGRCRRISPDTRRRRHGATHTAGQSTVRRGVPQYTDVAVKFSSMEIMVDH